MRSTRKRVPLPFIFRAADGLGADGKVIARSYGNVIEGVFTRTGKAFGATSSLALGTFGYGLPRFANVGGSSALLLEGATTNYLLQSQTVDNGSWSNTNVTVTANAVVAPDGTTTADTVAATSSAATTLSQTNTTISGTVATFSVYGRIGTGATDANRFLLYNATLSAAVAACTINWTTGVVTTTTGTCQSEDAGIHGGVQWWRIILTASSGITSGNDLLCAVGFDGATETASESAYFWGAQLEAAVSASSYVVTTTATANREVDTLYFPYTLVPQTCTIFVSGVEQSSPSIAHSTAAQVYVTLGDNASDPRALLYRESTTTGYVLLHDPATATNTAASTLGTAAVRGDSVELRGVLGADGSCTLGVTIGSGAETTNGPSTAQAFGAAWNLPRLYLHSTASGANPVNFGYVAVAVALGTKTRAEMRDLIEQESA